MGKAAADIEQARGPSTAARTDLEVVAWEIVHL